MAEEKHKDHRDLGQELDLFSFHEIAPGAPFWHGKGMIIFRELEKYGRAINKLTSLRGFIHTTGFIPTVTPQIFWGQSWAEE